MTERDHISGAFVQYDYTNQAWLHDGVYQKCGHILCNYSVPKEDGTLPVGKRCYGTEHEGETADPNAHLEPPTPIDAADMTWPDIETATLNSPESGWVDSDGVFHLSEHAELDAIERGADKWGL